MKYVCNVCGYAYDESAGDPDNGIAPGTKWEALPDGWKCKLCGAAKSDFESHEKAKEQKPIKRDDNPRGNNDLTELSFGEMSALFSNLAKGCEKQYRFKDAERFSNLAEFYKNISKSNESMQLFDIGEMVQENIGEYKSAKSVAEENSDRGALRALVWSEKVTRIVSSILGRYQKQKFDLLKDKKIYVCDICGFIYVGDKLPEVCPVCKVPKLKISEIKKEAI